MARPSERPRSDQTTDRDIDVTDAATDRTRDGARDTVGRSTAGGVASTTRGASAPDARADHVEDRPMTAVGNGYAIAALVTGLLSATYAFLAVSAIAAVLFGIVAIGLGAKGMGIAKEYRGMHRGLAISGIVSGVLGLLLGIAVIVGAVTLAEQTDTEDLPPAIQESLEDVTN